MNNIYLSLSNSYNSIPEWKKNVFSRLSIKQQQATIITSIAVGVLTAIAIIYYCSRLRISAPTQNSQFTHLSSISPPISPPSFPLPSPAPSSVPLPAPSPVLPPISSPAPFPTSAPVPFDQELIDKGQDIDDLRHVPKHLSELLKIEGKIKEARGGLILKQQSLEALEVGVIEEDDADGIIGEISSLEEFLAECLDSYPQIFYAYLEDKLKGSFGVGSKAEVYERITILTDWMKSDNIKSDKRNSLFIFEIVKGIGKILTNSFFNSKEICLSEREKENTIIFHGFFDIVNEHFDLIQEKDPNLAISLKIKLANLPLRVDRAKQYPKIYLSLRDQLNILIDHFQKQENLYVERLINLLQTKDRFSKEEMHKIAKIVSSDRSHVSDIQLANLQVTVDKLLATKSITLLNWNYSSIFEKLTICFEEDAHSSQVLETLSSFHKVSKAREFFANQEKLKEEEIQIPRWYHATKALSSVFSIISAKKIEVRKDNGSYEGAWVSNQREPSYGNTVFVFNHSIVNIDPKPSIKAENGKINWRGLQNPISFQDETVSRLVYVGLNKSIKKANSGVVKNYLKDAHITVSIYSFDFLDYIRTEYFSILGNPNLNEYWWGKADLSRLDGPIPVVS